LGILADEIEQYIKRLLAERNEGFLEIKRTELAELFMCVPSQISYVLETRFTAARGYLVESRRGGGGCLRIIKLGSGPEDEDLLGLVDSTIGKMITQPSGEGLLSRLEEEGFLNRREAFLLRAVIDRNTLQQEGGDSDLLRSRILRAVLIVLLREDL